jgi:hypothetical protein
MNPNARLSSKPAIIGKSVANLTDERLIYHSATRTPAATQDQFRIGIDDTIILPLVLIVLLAKTLYQAMLFIMPFVSAFVVTLFLRMVTFPLLVAATAGDGVTWLVKRLVDLPPLPGARREAWHRLVDRRWSGLRQRMSHRVIAMMAQNVLQRGSTWVFRKCGALSPRAALLVIISVMVWLPLSAAISIGMHAVLLAHAASLPTWMQLLHPVATVIAKSKLLVLPAYPAAWPQAKKHIWVQAAFRCVDRMAEFDSLRKTAHRYQQTKQAFAQSGDLSAWMKYMKSRRY